ncbi:MAG: metallophosphoesterase [Hyphomicrobiales bacterium]
MFSLAHLSDLHLGPLPEGAARRHFALKRSIGAMNWRLRRHKQHDPAVAAAIAMDIRSANPDHVACTGDIVNVAAHAEFPTAAAWLADFGPPDWISFVPGNHDTYVRLSWEHGLVHLADYMTGDMQVRQTQTSHQIAAPFPYVRLRRNVALIGLCSGEPQNLFKAGGRLGPVQLDSLQFLLRDLRERGFARVIMIHHPPLPGQAPPRKALEDAGPLRDLLVREGAELVLHGHNHEPMLTPLDTRFGLLHVLGVPSASIARPTHHPAAAWNEYRIARNAGKWLTQVTTRGWNDAGRHMETIAEFALST